MDVFGAKFNQELIQMGINRTNTNYGGYGMRATKIVFPNGSIDPWHFLGFTKDLSMESPAIYIQGLFDFYHTCNCRFITKIYS